MKPHALLPLLTAALGVIACPHGFAQRQAEGNETQDLPKPGDAQRVLSENFPPGSRHEEIMMPMRDGVKLAADVFLPPGAGPWPVIFARGYYGRLSRATVYAREAKGGGFVYLCQDARGVQGSEGKGTAKITSPDFELDDCADSLKWIAAQPWCNGRIGMLGASGNGIGPAAAFLVKDPHLIITQPSISTGYPYYYWGFQNGVARWLYHNWFGNTGLQVERWPKPTVSTFDKARWEKKLSDAAKDNSTELVLSTGWYDLGSESVLDFFHTAAPTCKVLAVVRPYAHKAAAQFTWPQRPFPFAIPKFPDALTGRAQIRKSQLAYYLMGNFRDPSSLGNVYKVTDVWPVPHTPVPYYLHADGSISTAKPAAEETPQPFAYDPRNPAPSLGGNATYDDKAGPADQRPLKERKDVLRFVSAPLDAPLEITGKLLADLYVSTDVPDTEFVVKVIDIHPDGYEMLLRESAVMGRCAEEFQGRPRPLEKDRIYHLKMDLWSTAILLDKGHRIGVLVTSSSAVSYEVHPNSFEPVMSYDASPVAHQKIHIAQRYPSSITIPVVTPAQAGTPGIPGGL